MWKGDNVLYGSIHDWVDYNLGKAPRKCEHCKSEAEKRYEWASKSHKAKKDLDDYISLCVRCHRTYDGNMPKHKSYDPETRRKISEAIKKHWVIRRKRLEKAKKYYGGDNNTGHMS